MQILDNGAIIGNWNTEKWDGNQLEVNGKNLTLCFLRIPAERCGMNAPTPSPHRHADVEQLTVMLEGTAIAIVDGKRIPVRKGSHWLAPPGIDHGLDLREATEGVTIVQIFPSGKKPPR
jgi:mannose-6-phosphate isomerase-like protein (cupin superfamily)